MGCQEFARFKSIVPVGQFLPLIAGQVSQFHNNILVQNTGLLLKNFTNEVYQVKQSSTLTGTLTTIS